jgi:hypothetical protein
MVRAKHMRVIKALGYECRCRVGASQRSQHYLDDLSGFEDHDCVSPLSCSVPTSCTQPIHRYKSFIMADAGVILEAEENPEYPFSATLSVINSFLRDKPHLQRPRVGIVCGSGLSTLAKSLKDVVEVPYSALKGFGHSTGARTRLILGAPSGD